MGEILECLEDLDLMSRRQGSTRHAGATREIDDGCRAGTAAQRTTASDILCRRLARKDQDSIELVKYLIQRLRLT